MHDRVVGIAGGWQVRNFLAQKTSGFFASQAKDLRVTVTKLCTRDAKRMRQQTRSAFEISKTELALIRRIARVSALSLKIKTDTGEYINNNIAHGGYLMVGKISRRSMLAMPALAVLPVRQVFAQASRWKPSRLVKIIVPQGAGGTSDVMARMFASYLQGRWNETVVAENKPGAGGIIGTQELLRSPPDGHTLLLGGASPQAIVFSLARSVPYTIDDVIGVSNLITGPNALIVNKSIPVKTVREFADYLKQNPDKVNFGTPGIGTTPHLAGVWFNALLGTKSTPVHYRGSALAMTDLLGGRMQYSFDALVNAREQIRGGTVTALGVTGAKRYPGLPELPTMKESMPELAPLVSESWVGIFVAKGTPNEIVQALNEEVRLFLAQPEIPERFLNLGGVPDYQPLDGYASFVRAEGAKWATVVRGANLQIDF